MNVEQDYIMRMIKEFANVLGRLLFNKKKPMYELDVTNRYHVGDDLYTRLCRMADEGKIKRRIGYTVKTADTVYCRSR